MTPLEVLIAARELLSDESRWTKETLAVGKYGPIGPETKGAVSWCSVGALKRCSITDIRAYHGAVEAITNVIARPSISNWNDSPTTTHADVLKVFDAAIEKARADG